MGTSWSWKAFAVSVGIGAVMGAYTGYSGVSTIGDAVTSVTHEAAPGATGRWASIMKWVRGLKGTVMDAINSPQQSAYNAVAEQQYWVMMLDSEDEVSESIITKAVSKKVTCMSLMKAVVSAPFNNAVPSGLGNAGDAIAVGATGVGYLLGNGVARSVCGI